MFPGPLPHLWVRGPVRSPRNEELLRHRGNDGSKGTAIFGLVEDAGQNTDPATLWKWARVRQSNPGSEVDLPPFLENKAASLRVSVGCPGSDEAGGGFLTTIDGSRLFAHQKHFATSAEVMVNLPLEMSTGFVRSEFGGRFNSENGWAL